MSRLLRRELLRLSPVALAMFAVGVLILFSALLLVKEQSVSPMVAWMVTVIVTLVTPWLLGVAAFAPDHESGAEAFLYALPLNRWRLLGLRLLAALLWTATVDAAFAGFLTAYYAVQGGPLAAAPVELLSVAAAGVIPLAAAALASLVTRRSLAAFATAPLFAVIPYALYSAFAEQVLGAPSSFTGVALVCLAPALLLAVLVVHAKVGVFRGLRRSLILSGGVLGGAVLLACGLTTGAYALEPASYTYGAGTRSSDGAVATLVCNTNSPWGRDWKGPAALSSHVLLESNPPGTWTLPRGLLPVSFSADGRDLLVRDLAGEQAADWRNGPWVIYDVATCTPSARGEVLLPWSGPLPGPLPGPRRLVSNPSSFMPVVWRQRQPYLVRQRELVSCVGSESLPFPSGHEESHVMDSAGRRLLLCSPGNRWSVWDLEQTPALSQAAFAAVPGAIRDAVLGIEGRWLFVLVTESKLPRLWALDLEAETPSPTRLDVDELLLPSEDDRPGGWTRVNSSRAGLAVVFAPRGFNHWCPEFCVAPVQDA